MAGSLKQNVDCLILGYPGEDNKLLSFKQQLSYTLMEKQIDILDYLEQPHSLEEISKYMGISVETALGQIKYLCDKQLLFEENNCYISLVL